jgi:ABC-type transporter Mla maintaining outer membrane lipid asymmetry permease subunit MlaE
MLVIIAGVLGIWGGRLAGSMTGIVPSATFDQGLLDAFAPYNVIFALYKAVHFCIYYFKHFGLLWLLRKGRCPGNRKS